jgi:RHS repeat-associated protein
VYETIYLGSTPTGALKQTGSATTSDIAVTLYNVHADHIDTPRLIAKQDETVVWRWDAAEAFGATAPDQNPTGQGVFAYNPRFPGQVFDAETGLFQNWNRDYDSRLGRYRQSDPIGLAGGINTFAYVEGDPISGTDPTGEFANFAIGALGGMISGYAIARLTGDECYGWEDALTDAALGAAGAGLVSKLDKLHRLSKLRSIARARGLENVGKKGSVETWKSPSSYERLDIKHKAGTAPELQPGSKVPRFAYKTDAGRFSDPFTGRAGPKGALSHVPLEPVDVYRSAVTGGMAGATTQALTGCGCSK